jgi:hypothetical protein
MTLLPAAQRTLAKWHDMIAKNDLADLPSIVAHDAIFRSPVAFTPYPGRDLVCTVLRAAAVVFEDFKYHRELMDGENAILEFSAHIGDMQLKAVDIIRFNAAGEIAEFEVMVRPAKGLMALGNAMAAKIGLEVKAALASG